MINPLKYGHFYDNTGFFKQSLRHKTVPLNPVCSVLACICFCSIHLRVFLRCRSHLVGGLEGHKKQNQTVVMLHTQHFHLICWQVAILSSQPVNEPVSHSRHWKTLTSCFHQLFGNGQILVEAALDHRGPWPSDDFFFLGSLHRDILLTF